jgi:hypothetical protein
MNAGSAAANCSRFIGYTTYRMDGGPTRPIIKADGVIDTFSLLIMGANSRVENIEFDGNSRTSSKGIGGGGAAGGIVVNCVGKNCTNGFISGTNLDRTMAIRCYATTCSTAVVFLDVGCFGCVAHANTFTAFGTSGNAGTFTNCIAAGNTGASTDGFSFANYGSARNCVSYGNGRDGYRFTALNNAAYAVNCVAQANTGTGFNPSAAMDGLYLYNCAAHGNGTNYSASLLTQQKVNCLTLTGDPFTNAAGQDFSLNNTAGAGASCRAAGLLGAFPTIGTTGYQDIGSAQHADPAAGGISRARSM